ncbi:class I SAM-dependent methyltransferase [Polynucleobacter paneuropaeus]|nr:class I SAM-dependent methyltransferase [Polynucleobacter paneuropaeus]
MQSTRLNEIFMEGKKLSIKNDSYFEIYEFLFSGYIDKPITFIEVGVFNGGSLHMWRNYFGPKARIIGVDLNPIALELKSEGFEIFIGDQESPDFWSHLKKIIGCVDIILDDGGHKNGQQIASLWHGVDLIRDGGVLVVEDTHTSYFKRFGNPSPTSFINYSKRIIDKINSRFKYVKSSGGKYVDCIWSISYFESIVAFHINRKNSIVSAPISNQGVGMGALDYRNQLKGSIVLLEKLERLLKVGKKNNLWNKIITKIFDHLTYGVELFSSIKLLRYFD